MPVAECSEKASLGRSGAAARRSAMRASTSAARAPAKRLTLATDWPATAASGASRYRRADQRHAQTRDARAGSAAQARGRARKATAARTQAMPATLKRRRPVAVARKHATGQGTDQDRQEPATPPTAAQLRAPTAYRERCCAPAHRPSPSATRRRSPARPGPATTRGRSSGRAPSRARRRRRSARRRRTRCARPRWR